MHEGITAYIGLDVHKDSIAIAAAGNDREVPHFVGTVRPDFKRVRKALSHYGSASSLQVVYEAGPCGYTLARQLLADGFRTVALTYIGSELTAPIYRSGTIGAAKKDLEATASGITADLEASGGRAWTSVNGAAVTQASTHIPGIALYTSLLRAVLGPAGHHQPASRKLLRMVVARAC